MLRPSVFALVWCVSLSLSCTGSPTPATGDATEGEGDAREGEGEGDASEGEGEGDASEGEGEGDAGEGEGDAGEGEGDAGEGEGDAGEGEGEGEGETITTTECFAGIGSQTGVAPDYEQFAPQVGSHCYGTNQQDIEGVERVVFLGDSVTVGSPPTSSSDFYRARLADMLAQRFGLEAPSGGWKSYNALDGTSLVQNSGAFWSCAKWGARADDLMQDNSQVLDCFPLEERTKKTLVIMTMGGNDIASFTKAGLEGKPLDEITQDVEDIIAALKEAVRFLKDPVEFPAGNYVVFANPPEFTDGTGDTQSCPSASLAGFNDSWDDPAALATLVVHMMEEYMALAVETQTDLVFFLETFCGHGYHHDDPRAACYRGPDTPIWFDFTCIHPNPVGHAQLADMFMAVVNE